MTTQQRSSLWAMVTHQATWTKQVIYTVLLTSALFTGTIGMAANAHPLHRSSRISVSSQSMDIEDIETDIINRINQQRRRYGRRPLQVNSHLTQAARAFSQQMAEHRFYSHTGPQGDTPRQRVEAKGVRAKLVGENIIKFSQRLSRRRSPAAVAVQSWMKSPGHQRNILLPQMSETGIGIWKQNGTYYMTQLFIEPKTGAVTTVANPLAN